MNAVVQYKKNSIVDIKWIISVFKELFILITEVSEDVLEIKQI